MSLIDSYNGYSNAINVINAGTDYGPGSNATSGQLSVSPSAILVVDRDTYAQLLGSTSQNEQASYGAMQQMSNMFNQMMGRMMAMFEKLAGMLSEKVQAAQETTPPTQTAPVDPAATSPETTPSEPIVAPPPTEEQSKLLQMLKDSLEKISNVGTDLKDAISNLMAKLTS